MTTKHGQWLNADVQAHIDPTSILHIKLELEDECTIYIIKVDMWRNPTSAMSETYNIHMSTFDDVQSE